MRGFKLPTDYPAGLKPWDGRFDQHNDRERPAAVVVLALSDDGRAAEEYAFNFSDDGFQVLGRRARVLVSPKRARWAPFVVPFLSQPWVPYEVAAAAAKRWKTSREQLLAQLQAEHAKRASEGNKP